MGLFSSKKKTVVDTAVMRVIEDFNDPETKKVAVLQAILQDENIPDRLLENMQTSVAVRAERMYRRAQANYVHGLPSGKMVSTQEGVAEATEVLSALEGQPIAVEYSQLAPANRLHVAWMRLIAQHGYNPATNILATLSSQKGTSVYLEDIRIEIPALELPTLPEECMEQWGIAANAGYTPTKVANYQDTRRINRPTPLRQIAPAGPAQQQARVIYSWAAPRSGNWFVTDHPNYTPPIASGELIISLADLDQDDDYLHVKYNVGGVTKYWMYKIGTGTYPSLDGLYNTPPDTAGSFFPFIFFRHNKTKFNETNFGQAYRDSKRLCKIIGMDYDSMLESIHENPDIGDVTQAVMTFALPPKPTSQIELRYLFDFFSEQALYQDVTVRQANSPNTYWLNQVMEARGRLGTRHAIVIQDALFKMSLGFNQIFRTTRPGSIGAKGTYAFELTHRSETHVSIDSEGLKQTRYTSIPVYNYKYQISEQYYHLVRVEKLSTEYRIEGELHTLSDELDEQILIPLDHSITSTYSMPDREELYTKAMHFVFNSKVTYKVKWYQTSFFKFLLTAVGIVIAAFTFGASAMGQALLAYSIGMTTLQAVVLVAITGLMTGIAASYAFQLFVKTVGAEIAFLVAIAAVMASAYFMVSSGSITGAPWASDLLKLANGLTSSIESVIQSDIADLMADQTAYAKEMEEQLKLLETANELLEPSGLLHPYTIFGESPDDFYNRTVHSGNIGILGIDAITNYVDLSLTLPTFSETVGDTFNGLP